MDQKKYNLIGIDSAINKTVDSITKKTRVLKTRFNKVNQILKGGFPEGKYFNISGTSGMGKSYFLNNLMMDFQDKSLNTYDVVHLHFNLEMEVEEEITRIVENISNIPYYKIMNMKYNDLSKEEMKTIKDSLKFIKENYNLYFYDVVSPSQIIDISTQVKKDNPDKLLVVSLDHYLLTDADTSYQQDEVRLVRDTSAAFKIVKKKCNALCIMVGQLNDKIEDRTKPNEHFPRKGDLFSSKASYRDPDYVLVVHRPNKFGIRYYGPDKIPVDKYDIFLHVLKGRFLPEDGLFTRLKQKGNRIVTFKSTTTL